MSSPNPAPLPVVEDVEINGHVIDSLILPKILDLITGYGGAFKIKQITIGQQRNDPSFALIEVQANSRAELDQILGQISDHGAVPAAKQDCRLVEADMDAAFPEGFYSTTNQRTEIRRQGHWQPVADQEMDCGIRVDPKTGEATCIAMTDVRQGESYVVGHAGVRVFPEQRNAERRLFEFMASSVSSEKPKGVAIREVAHQLHRTRKEGGKVLFVGGPAIVHTGSGPHICKLLREKYIDVLFAGNALATHDIEQSLFGTSLGVYLDRGVSAEEGHEHHLRAINRIRRLGGIRKAVESGNLQSGIMYECIQNDIDFLLAGSIRDDGPLPEVITDVLVAQREMRAKIKGVTFALMVATTLHSIAVGNLLPGWVNVVCVDINPSTVIKLNDRGSIQTVGLVTDVEPFLRVLVGELDAINAGGGLRMD